MALFTRYSPTQNVSWFSVLLAINGTLSSAIVGGLVIIYKKTQRFSVRFDPGERSVYSSARLSKKLAVSTTACWLWLGAVVLMEAAGVAALDMARDALIVFGLPLSSALYPFLRLGSFVTERQAREREQKLLQKLKLRYKMY